MPTEEILAKDPDGTIFYRERPDDGPPRVTRVFRGRFDIDWLMLSRQKYRLCLLTVGDPNDILNGLIDLIDSIQEQADAAGQPVVWFRNENDE